MSVTEDTIGTEAQLEDLKAELDGSFESDETGPEDEVAVTSTGSWDLCCV